ncbi:MAG: flagellar motor switch protein FliN [Methylocystaceae bacterium]|nr:MAG: flagellar motor switch protein FliN [Methylocystaceae bacterium]
MEDDRGEEFDRAIGGRRVDSEDGVVERPLVQEIDQRKLESILRIPVVLQVIVGSVTMPVANLLKLGRGAVVPLDHKLGEPVDVVVNGRLIARGEVVVVEDDNTRFGVSLTEIIEPGIAQRRA